MMLDPQADLGRRAWLPCTSCGEIPLYLLDSDVNLIWCNAATAYAAGATTPVSATGDTQRTCSTSPDRHTCVPKTYTQHPPASVQF